MSAQRSGASAQGKSRRTWPARSLLMLAVAGLAMSSSALSATSHYSLHATFKQASVLPTGQRRPQAIVQGQDGYIFGFSTAGGYSGQGGVFGVRPTGEADSMWDFGGDFSIYGWEAAPALPSNNFTPLAMLPDGTFVAVSNRGGYNTDATQGDPQGVAFIQSITGASHVVHRFYREHGDVSNPQSIALGSDGNVYGLALGGTWAGDTVTSNANLFRMSLGGAVTNVFSFMNAPTNFVLGTDGCMYVSLAKGVIPPGETTPASGDVIYKVTRDGVGSVLYTMDPAVDGQVIDELVMDSQGNLYGSALTGGPLGQGTVFRVDTASGDFTVLHDFGKSTAAKPLGYSPNSLVAGSDGNVYGMTRAGGSASTANGTLFRVTPSGTYSVLHTFGTAATEGTGARSLIQGGPRTFYGVVDQGPTGQGAIFQLVVPVQDDVNGTGRSSVITSGPGVLSTAGLDGAASSVSAGDGYYPAASGDLNGDGLADVVWTSSRKDLYVWFGGESGFEPVYLGAYPSGWKLVGAGDVDADGKDDLIWLNAGSRQFAYWLMNGARRTGSRIIKINPGYYPAVLADLDGNGKLDILWTSSKRDLYTWLGTGVGFTSKYLGTYPAGWRLAGRGDVDGDGRDDLVWATTDSSQWGYWLMNGASVSSRQAFGRPAELDGYSVAATGDYNGDGLVDLLWSNGSDAQAWTDQGHCSIGTRCNFAESGSGITLPAGQAILNSALPSSRTSP